jgi:hypothetical protein
MSPLLASTVLSTEAVAILVFVSAVLPGVSLISLIANWLIRPWWLASMIGPLVCLLVFVWLGFQNKADAKRVFGPRVNSAVYLEQEAKRDREYAQFVTEIALLSRLPSFAVGVALSHKRRKRQNTSGA